MGRGRGKGKKLTVVVSHEEPGSGGEEPLPAYKRRGRPQKPLKDDIDDDEVEKIEEVEADKPKPPNLNKEKKAPVVGENGKKRKRHSQAKLNQDSVKEENGVSTKPSTDNIKSNGFRQNGSRRKSKPRRAAEAGVNCKLVVTLSSFKTFSKEKFKETSLKQVMLLSVELACIHAEGKMGRNESMLNLTWK